MNIFANLPFEFLGKIVLFSFDMTKIIYITFVIFSVINENMIIKYIILY